jgi:hypothetical protein
MIRDTISLEYVLSAYARPTFLTITEPDEDNDIQVVISSNIFKNMEPEDRIEYVFNLIRSYIPDILLDRLVIVQAFDSDEIIEVLENAFDENEYF